MSTKHICTIVDKNYLFKAVAQYQSLEKTSSNFVWWVLVMDSTSYKMFSKLNLKNARLVKLSDVENNQLRNAKKDRTMAEYCWTLKASFIKYLFNQYSDIKSVLYLDGDMLLYDNIDNVFKLVENYSIGITPHNFPPKMKRLLERSGRFNAGLVYFKKDIEGLACLERWRKQCIDWCYHRLEDGKLCDQMYLNEWPKLYKNVHIFKHKGINVAPWNVNSFKLSSKGKGVYVNSYPLIIYHFHQFEITSSNSFERTFGYTLNKQAILLIYQPYENMMSSIIEKVQNINPTFDYGIKSKKRAVTLKSYFTKRLTNIYWGVSRYVRN